MNTVGRQGGDFVSVKSNIAGLQHSPENEINALEQVIGRLPDHIKHDYVHNQSRAYGDLTELLIKRAPKMVRNYVTGLLIDGYVSPFTQWLLPIRRLQPNEGITVKWTEINFDPGLAPQVEVEGVAPIWTHNETEHGARAVRRAAGVKIESGFFMTAEGREQWRNKIEHLAAIIQRTNEFGVMMTLLQTPWNQERHANEMNGPYNLYGAKSDISFEDRLKMEIDMFGLVNKTTDSRGFSNLCTAIRTNMRFHGVTPNALIVPPFMLGHYYFTKPDLWHYESAGPEVAANRAKAVDIGGDSAYRNFEIQGMKVVDTYIYRPIEGGTQDAIDLLTVPAQIGEFYPVEINSVYADLEDFKRYKTRSRNIRLFNERHGRIVPVKFQDMIENCLRWDDNGRLDPRTHDGVDGNEMFQNFFQPGAPAQVWGHSDTAYFPEKHHRRVLQTFENKFTPDEVKELNSLINRFLELHNYADLQPARIRTEAGVFIDRNNGEYPRTRDAFINVILETLKQKVCDMVGRVTGMNNPVTVDEIRAFLSDVQDLTANQAGNPPRSTFNVDGNYSGDLAMFSTTLTPLQKLLMFGWVRVPIRLPNMLTMADNDIYVPVNFLLSRPYMTYVASSCIFMEAGSDTGETIIGRNDFQMTSNNMDRTLYASYVYYVGHYVKNKRKVTVAPHVFIQSYVKGNDTTFIKAKDLGEIRERGGLKHSRNSILCYMVPPESNVMQHNIIDIRGFHPELKPSEGGKFYPCSDYYESLLRIDEDNLASPADAHVDYEHMDYKCKSYCCLGHFEFGEGYSQINTNTGHLGPNTYDQVNLSRTPGQYVPVKHITYNSKIIQ
jgi:hypothetical protein